MYYGFCIKTNKILRASHKKTNITNFKNISIFHINMIVNLVTSNIPIRILIISNPMNLTLTSEVGSVLVK